MDREEIIRIAREAGFRDTTHPIVALGVSWEQVERFATLIAAAEREACAKACDVLAVHPEYASDITKVAAQVIRARGKK